MTAARIAPPVSTQTAILKSVHYQENLKILANKINGYYEHGSSPNIVMLIGNKYNGRRGYGLMLENIVRELSVYNLCKV